MKKQVILCLSGLVGLTVGPHASSTKNESATTVPYLLSDASSFDLSTSQFRKKFNADNSRLPSDELHPIATSRDQASPTRAASRINENLYASTALERGTLKIGSMQIVWLSAQGPEQKAVKVKALGYMSTVVCAFVPTLSPVQSQQKLQRLLTIDKGKRCFVGTEGAVCCVVADHGEEGLTFTIEPIKLALSEMLEGNNR